VYSFKRPAVLFGSDPRCKVQLSSRSVSRFHAVLVQAADSAWVVDLASREGTFVSGAAVSHARIGRGLEIQFGRVKAHVQSAPEDGESLRLASEPADSGVLSEDFVRDLIGEFRASQRETLTEMRQCLTDVVQSFLAHTAQSAAATSELAALLSAAGTERARLAQAPSLVPPAEQAPAAPLTAAPPAEPPPASLPHVLPPADQPLSLDELRRRMPVIDKSLQVDRGLLSALGRALLKDHPK
jgi:hypothetical protein